MKETLYNVYMALVEEDDEWRIRNNQEVDELLEHEDIDSMEHEDKIH